MDLIVMLIMLLIAVAIKLCRAGGIVNHDIVTVVQSDGAVVEKAVSSVPVGNNLDLKREPMPYVKFLRIMGLIQ